MQKLIHFLQNRLKLVDERDKRKPFKRSEMHDGAVEEIMGASCVAHLLAHLSRRRSK